MPIWPAANAKKGNVPHSSKRKIRPIIREEFSEDVSARAVFLAQNAGKLSKGRNTSQHGFGGSTAGQTIQGGINGGTYSPNSAPSNSGNIGST